MEDNHIQERQTLQTVHIRSTESRDAGGGIKESIVNIRVPLGESTIGKILNSEDEAPGLLEERIGDPAECTRPSRLCWVYRNDGCIT